VEKIRVFAGVLTLQDTRSMFLWSCLDLGEHKLGHSAFAVYTGRSAEPTYPVQGSLDTPLVRNNVTTAKARASCNTARQ
jgi:hypothetical protein